MPELKATASADIVIYDSNGQALSSTLGVSATDPLFLRTLSIDKDFYKRAITQDEIVEGENFEVEGRLYRSGFSPLKVSDDRIAVFAVILPMQFVVESSSPRAVPSRRTMPSSSDLSATVGELPGCLEALFRNHESRWRGKGKQGVFVDMCKREFYSKLASRLLGSGTLRFFHLKLDGSVVAQQFCFQHGDTVFLLQEGFDFEHANLNVGNVLRLMVFEHLISNRVRQYDFLAGTSRHKQSWSDAAPFDINVRACRP